MPNALKLLACLAASISPLTVIYAQNGPTTLATSAVNCMTQFTDPVPRGNVGTWVTSEDYPPSALRAEEQGKVIVRFYVTAEGRIESAEIVESDASPTLQQAALNTVRRRGRFIPATRKCLPVPGEYTGTFRWILPQE